MSEDLLFIITSLQRLQTFKEFKKSFAEITADWHRLNSYDSFLQLALLAFLRWDIDCINQ